MGKAKKSTKKYVKKSLGDEIKKRRQHRQIKAGRARGSKGGQKDEAIFADEGRANERLPRPGDFIANSQAPPSKKRVEDMDVDELMRGDFLGSDDDDLSDHADNSEEDQPSDAELGDDEDLEVPAGTGTEEESSEEEGEDNPVKAENKKLRTEVSKHRQELDALKEKDPEFFEYLQQYDKELLEFDEDEEEEGGDEEGVHKEEKEAEEEPKGKGPLLLTTAMVDTWIKAAQEKHSLVAVKSLLKAFRAACHYGDPEEKDEAVSMPMSIASSNVFNRIMVFVLKEMDSILKSHLKLPAEGAKGAKSAAKEIDKSPRWKKVEPLVKSYLGNALHILGQMTDNPMIAFTLRRLRASVTLLGPFPKFQKKYLKLALHFWGTGDDSLRLLSLLFIRDMASQLGPEVLALCMKGIYRTYSQNVKFVSAMSAPGVSFMGNCVAEVYGVDLGVAYQHAFVFIRQMAMVLRKALAMKTKESYKEVYCWQFIKCLEVWVTVFSTYANRDELRPLVYPLTQIIIGAARLVPTARFFPLRLQCVRMLNHLAAPTGHFIPVSALCLEVLQFRELSRAPTGGAGKSADFFTTLKVPKPSLKTRSFQEDSVSLALELLAEHLAQWATSIAFPELALPVVLQLRKFAKTTSVERFRRDVKSLVDAAERNADFVKRHRDSVNFSPKDVAQVAAFLQAERESQKSPFAQYYNGLKQRADQRRQALVKSEAMVGGGKQRKAKAKVEDLDDDNDGDGAFAGDWLPEKRTKLEKSNGRPEDYQEEREVEVGDGDDKDVVGDLIWSDEEEGDDDDEAPSTSPEDDIGDEAHAGHQRAVANEKSKGKEQVARGSMKKGEKRSRYGVDDGDRSKAKLQKGPKHKSKKM